MATYQNLQYIQFRSRIGFGQSRSIPILEQSEIMGLGFREVMMTIKMALETGRLGFLLQKCKDGTHGVGGQRARISLLSHESDVLILDEEHL